MGLAGRLRRTLRDDGGSAYVWLCAAVCAVCLLLSALLLYMGLAARARAQRREVSRQLDSALSAYAAEMFGALKQGGDCGPRADADALRRRIRAELGAGPGSGGTSVRPDGSLMRDPEITILRGDGFGATVRYTAVFPIRWNGRTLESLEIPMSVTSYYRFR